MYFVQATKYTLGINRFCSEHIIWGKIKPTKLKMLTKKDDKNASEAWRRSYVSSVPT